jgi:hypothetical protein
MRMHYCRLAEEAMIRMTQLLGHDHYHVQTISGKSITLIETIQEDSDHLNTNTNTHSNSTRTRSLTLQCGNMFDIPSLEGVDIVMMETDIPVDQYYNLQRLLSTMQDGGRVLTYLDLRKVWEPQQQSVPFRQLNINRNLSDRYPTSWSVQRGHHFYLWSKVPSLRMTIIYVTLPNVHM